MAGSTFPENLLSFRSVFLVQDLVEGENQFDPLVGPTSTLTNLKRKNFYYQASPFLWINSQANQKRICVQERMQHHGTEVSVVSEQLQIQFSLM